MRSEGSGGWIIIVIISFLAGVLGVYFIQDRETINEIQTQLDGLAQQVVELETKNAKLETELSDVKIGLAEAEKIIINYEAHAQQLKTHLNETGMWTALDAYSTEKIDSMLERLPAPQPTAVVAPTLVPEPPPGDLKERPNFAGVWEILAAAAVLIAVGVASHLYRYYDGLPPKNIRMAVTRKEVEVINHLRRNKYN
jgi:hypothetical protein